MSFRTQHCPLLAALWAGLAVVPNHSGLQAASVSTLGDFPDGFWSRALSVSADGSVIAGTSYQFDGSRRAFRWTALSGLTDLGSLNEATDNVVLASSADGNKLVGWSGIDGVTWTPTTGLQPLAHLVAGGITSPTAISADGSTVIGFENSLPVCWKSNTAATALGLPTGLASARPGAITRNASFIGGAAGLNLVRWSGTTPTVVANFPAEVAVSGLTLSDDGALLAGVVNHPGGNGSEAVRWVEGGGVSYLGDLPGGDANSAALGTTANGHTIVGYGSDLPFWTTATIWTAATGWQRLADVLIAQGVNLSYWDSLDEATAISPDGRFIVGSGTVAATFLQEAFIAEITPLATPVSTPYGGITRSLPGRVQAEDYDVGGPRVAYLDTTLGNAHGAYRADSVDILANSDGTGGTAVVISPREWLNYSVNVASAGNYVLRFRVSRNGTGNGALKVSLGPTQSRLTVLINSLSIPNTGSTTTYTVVEADVTLTSGAQVLQLVGNTGDVRVNWLEVVPRGIRREVWTGVTGTAVTQIPTTRVPHLTDTLSTAEAPQNWANNYGTRLRGYLKAPTTGSYRFWVAGDDAAELWLSTSANPASRVRISRTSAFTGFREWNKNTTQRSAAINLVAGTLYYVEALKKEGSGSDNLSVGWSRPGQSTSAPSEIIPTAVLSPFLP